MRTSIFRCVSLGEAAENLTPNDPTLEVWPKEILPSMDGDITPDQVVIETKGSDVNGEEYSASAKIGTTIKAEWLGGGNSIVPPNVRRGERLRLWQSGDSDKFYWTTMGRDQNLRRLETIIIVVSANPSNKDQEEPTPRNSYYLEISTHKKLITFSTSMLNGEKASFKIQINTGDGKIAVEDEKGNSFEFDSVNTYFRFLNKDDSKFEIIKEIINVFTKDSINYETQFFNLIAEKEINFRTKKFFMEATESITMLTKATTLKSDDTIDITTKATTIKSADTINIDTKNFKLNTSSTTIKGNITLDGPVTTTDLVTAAGPITGLSLATGSGSATIASGGAMTAPTINASAGKFSSVKASMVKTSVLSVG